MCACAMGKMESVLCRAHEQLLLWETSRKKAIHYLSSLANLVEQLEVVQRCLGRPDKLGVLSQHSLALQCLQGKLVAAIERVMASVQAERLKLNNVVSELSKCSREGEQKLKQLIGLKKACSRSSQTFSSVDQCHWLRLVHSTYFADTEDKTQAVGGLCYTAGGLRDALGVWDRDPLESSEVVRLLRYSVRERGSSV